MTDKHTFVVLTNPVEGREEEYNDWYTNHHLADVVRIPGIVAAQRFRLSAHQRMPAPYPYKYCALYEIETDDRSGIVATLKARAGTDAMPISDAMAEQKRVLMFEPITGRVLATG